MLSVPLVFIWTMDQLQWYHLRLKLYTILLVVCTSTSSSFWVHLWTLHLAWKHGSVPSEPSPCNETNFFKFHCGLTSRFPLRQRMRGRIRHLSQNICQDFTVWCLCCFMGTVGQAKPGIDPRLINLHVGLICKEACLCTILSFFRGTTSIQQMGDRVPRAPIQASAISSKVLIPDNSLPFPATLRPLCMRKNHCSTRPGSSLPSKSNKVPSWGRTALWCHMGCRQLGRVF